MGLKFSTASGRQGLSGSSPAGQDLQLVDDEGTERVMAWVLRYESSSGERDRGLLGRSTIRYRCELASLSR
jgi:hypothetical protein